MNIRGHGYWDRHPKRFTNTPPRLYEERKFLNPPPSRGGESGEGDNLMKSHAPCYKVSAHVPVPARTSGIAALGASTLTGLIYFAWLHILFCVSKYRTRSFKSLTPPHDWSLAFFALSKAFLAFVRLFCRPLRSLRARWSRS